MYEKYSPKKKKLGFTDINKTLNINIENTRIMEKILDQFKNIFFNIYIYILILVDPQI